MHLRGGSTGVTTGYPYRTEGARQRRRAVPRHAPRLGHVTVVITKPKRPPAFMFFDAADSKGEGHGLHHTFRAYAHRLHGIRGSHLFHPQPDLARVAPSLLH